VRAGRGQALVELAVCLPAVMVLGFGAAAVVEVADAASGLGAATEAAVSAAARAPDATQAQNAAQTRFGAVIADYPVRSATFVLAVGDFSRGSVLTGAATGFVDLGWVALAGLPARVELSAQARMRVEPWRTR